MGVPRLFSTMPLLPPSHPSFTQLRSFTCTARTLAKSTKKRLAFEHSAVPPYPFGPSQIYKQSNFGLYGTQKIRFGNMVSEKNEIKTRRYWRPNVHSKRLWSESLGSFVKIRITTRVLRTLDKCGGLDEYLLGEKTQRIKELGMGGWKLRWRIMQTDKVKERFRLQRKKMGLPDKEEILIGSNGNLVTQAQVDEEVKLYDQELERAGVEVGDDVESTTMEPGFMSEESAPRRDKVLV